MSHGLTGAWILAAGLSVAACTVHPPQHGVSHHVGYLRLVQDTDPQTASFHGQKKQALGVWVGSDGLGAGWSDTLRLDVPLDCRLVILVNTPEDLNTARTLIEGLDQEEMAACAFTLPS